jgi:hypothetical protein
MYNLWLDFFKQTDKFLIYRAQLFVTHIPDWFYRDESITSEADKRICTSVLREAMIVHRSIFCFLLRKAGMYSYPGCSFHWNQKYVGSIADIIA